MTAGELGGELEHTRDETTTIYVPSPTEGTVQPGSSSGRSALFDLPNQTKAKGTKTEDGLTQGHATGNLVGRLNNLVTTDLGNITGARDVLYIVVYIPMQITLCMLFLYLILGWRYVDRVPEVKNRHLTHFLPLVHS